MGRGTPAKMAVVWTPPRMIWLAVALAAVPFALLALAVAGDDGPVPRLDRRVADSVHDAVVDHPLVTDATKVVTKLGQGDVFIPLMIVASAFFLWHRRPGLVLYVVVASIGAGWVDDWMKSLVGRDRPLFDDPIAIGTGKAFPSGHAMSSTATYGALLLALLPFVPTRWRRAAIITTVVVVLAVGASRIVLGVHWFSDVVAGHVLGLAWLALVTAVFELAGVRIVSPETAREESGSPS